MYRHVRPIFIGASIGSVAALLFMTASVVFSAHADEEPLRTMMSTPAELFPRAFDPDNLVRIDDAHYLFSVEPRVSLAATNTVTVRKIGYGKVEMVTIATTPSGVYSSDGLTSPHIRYPGIEVERFRPADAASVVIITPGDAEDGSCFYKGSIAIC